MKLKNLIGIGLSSLVVGALALSGGIIAVQAGKTGEEALKNAAESKLTVVRDLQKHSIENYLNTIRSQIKTFANNEMTVYAMNSFTMAFSSFEYDSNISASASEQAAGLSDYYNNHYNAEYSDRNHGKSIGTQQLLNELSPISQKLQFSYIHSNSNPLGEKHKLDSTGDGSRYDTIHKNLHHKMRAFLEEFGYYDIFLIEPESGTIVYSVFKELDFATSVTTGPYAGTGIGDVFRQAMDKGTPGEVFISDFAPYPPSYEDPAAFLSSAIFEEGEKIGVLVFQIPIDKLNAIMSNNRRWEEAGLGKTGESFLIGGDTKMRSVSRMLIQEPEALKAEMEKVGMNMADLDTMILKETSIGLLNVNNQTSQHVLNGQTGITTDISYHGTPVLSAYAPLDIPGLHWGIISEISEKEAVADAESLMASVLQLAGATIIGLGLLAIIAGRVFASKLSSPLVSASELAQTIAEGNLLSGDSNCRSKNEIGDLSRALSSMSDKLNQIITRIYQGSNDLDSSAREFASTSENLARRTEQQANSIRETASTLHDLSEIASSNASLANKASGLTRDMQSNASCGQEAMTSMMDSIKEIKESSSRILDVVDVVEEIAFQTNLLALNASVEAARAGEHGRGFAVVATEVRNLALRSATAVKEIDTLAKESNARVEQGNSHAERMDTIIHAIRNSAENVMGTVNEIGKASKNQADAISNLNDTIRTIDETTQKNAASVQESAVGSKRLETLAQELQENVSYFSLQGESAPQPNLIRPRSPA